MCNTVYCGLINININIKCFLFTMCVYYSIGCHFLYTQIRVYTEMKQVLDHLKHPRFQFTENEEEADIIWTFSHVRDYRWARLRARTLRLFLVLVQWLKFSFVPLIHLLLENWVRNGLMSCSTSSPVRRCWPLKTAWHLWHGEPGEVRGLRGSLTPLIYRLSSHSSSDITYRDWRGERLYDHSAGKKWMWGTAIFH